MTFLQIGDSLQSGQDLIQHGNSLWSKVQDMALEYAPKIVGAILVYIIGTWLIGKISKLIQKVLSHKHFDTSLQKFLLSIVSVLLKILLFLAIAGMIGVNITGFAALLAGAGLAIGAALNGSLGNLAGGVMVMIFKPFKVGDLIEAQDSMGVVTEIGIFCTTLLTVENKTIILPNGALSTGKIINYTTHGNLRVDIKMAVALDNEIEKVRAVAIEAMLSHPLVLKTPAPGLSVEKLSVGMINVVLTPYTLQANYWDVFFGVQEIVKNAFDKNQITSPTPTQIIIQKQDNN